MSVVACGSLVRLFAQIEVLHAISSMTVVLCSVKLLVLHAICSMTVVFFAVCCAGCRPVDIYCGHYVAVVVSWDTYGYRMCWLQMVVQVTFVLYR